MKLCESRERVENGIFPHYCVKLNAYWILQIKSGAWIKHNKRVSNSIKGSANDDGRDSNSCIVNEKVKVFYSLSVVVFFFFFSNLGDILKHTYIHKHAPFITIDGASTHCRLHQSRNVQSKKIHVYLIESTWQHH